MTDFDNSEHTFAQVQHVHGVITSMYTSKVHQCIIYIYIYIYIGVVHTRTHSPSAQPASETSDVRTYYAHQRQKWDSVSGKTVRTELSTSLSTTMSRKLKRLWWRVGRGGEEENELRRVEEEKEGGWRRRRWVAVKDGERRHTVALCC